MRTPDEIKKGLEVCGKQAECNRCGYFHSLPLDENCVEKLLDDALACIQQLERERDQFKRERAAAVEDIRKAAFCGCHVCKHYYRPDPNVRKYACKIHGSFEEHDFIADDGSIWCSAMEWRGVQREVEA